MHLRQTVGSWPYCFMFVLHVLKHLIFENDCYHIFKGDHCYGILFLGCIPRDAHVCAFSSSCGFLATLLLRGVSEPLILTCNDNALFKFPNCLEILWILCFQGDAHAYAFMTSYGSLATLLVLVVLEPC